MNLSEDAFTGCRDAWRQQLSIPIYPALTDAEASRVVAAVKQIRSQLR